MALIGIGGEKGVGKNTAAQYYVSKGYKEVAFSTPLKLMLSSTLGIPLDTFENRDLKDTNYPVPLVLTEQNLLDMIGYMSAYLSIGSSQYEQMVALSKDVKILSPRHLLQFVGTDLFRTVLGEDVWINVFRRSHDFGDKLIVSDVRFANERKLIKSHGYLVRLKRDVLSKNDTHPSETSLGSDSEYDIVINNTGTVEELHKAIASYAKT